MPIDEAKLRKWLAEAISEGDEYITLRKRRGEEKLIQYDLGYVEALRDLAHEFFPKDEELHR